MPYRVVNADQNKVRAIYGRPDYPVQTTVRINADPEPAEFAPDPSDLRECESRDEGHTMAGGVCQHCGSPQGLIDARERFFGTWAKLAGHEFRLPGAVQGGRR